MANTPDGWPTVGAGDVALILQLIATMPNQRSRPLPSDLPGEFDLWFDGGACNFVTGNTDYRFSDGTRASVGVISGRIAYSRPPRSVKENNSLAIASPLFLVNNSNNSNIGPSYSTNPFRTDAPRHPSRIQFRTAIASG